MDPVADPALAGLTVRDVMLTAPKTLPADTTCDGAAAAFRDDHVHMLLLTSGGLLRGALTREALGDATGAGPALDLAQTTRHTVGPDDQAEVVHARMVTTGTRRLAVVDEAGALLGLVCLKRHLGGFCSDAGVAARAASHRDHRASTT